MSTMTQRIAEYQDPSFVILGSWADGYSVFGLRGTTAGGGFSLTM